MCATLDYTIIGLWFAAFLCALYVGVRSFVLLHRAGRLDIAHLASSMWLFKPGHLGPDFEPQRRDLQRAFVAFFGIAIALGALSLIAQATCHF
jgi:hypothetical protein